MVGDHAGNGIPEQLDRLGLSAAELSRHIALDIGVSQLGARLAALLDVTFVEQRYSRLVIDCNRSLDDPESIAVSSDGTRVPRNVGLTTLQRDERRQAIFAPYHQTIADLLEARDRELGEGATILVSLHSFTPSMQGIHRPWQIGVLHGGGNSRFAREVLSRLRESPGIVVGDNEPYRMDETDHTVPRHAFDKARPYIEFEVRQDEVTDAAGQERFANLLSDALIKARSAVMHF